MRALIGITFLLVMCGVTAAQDAIDPAKLVGSWERPGDKAKKQGKIVAEFAADGKAKLIFGEEADVIIDFKYQIEGNAFVLTHKTRDGDVVRKFTVTKLTSEVMDAAESNGERYNFKRITVVKKEK